MPDLQVLADRLDIAALSAAFTDAGVTRDFDAFAALFTEDGTWRMPHINAEFRGRETIRAAVEKLQSLWEFFVQTPHPPKIELDGDGASGRSLVFELGRMHDGRNMSNYGVYYDRYERTAEGWRFADRVYEIRYTDNTVLAGSAPPLNSGSLTSR